MERTIEHVNCDTRVSSVDKYRYVLRAIKEAGEFGRSFDGIPDLRDYMKELAQNLDPNRTDGFMDCNIFLALAEADNRLRVIRSGDQSHRTSEYLGSDTLLILTGRPLEDEVIEDVSIEVGDVVTLIDPERSGQFDDQVTIKGPTVTVVDVERRTGVFVTFETSSGRREQMLVDDEVRSLILNHSAIVRDAR